MMDKAAGSVEEARTTMREAMMQTREHLGLSAEKFGKLCGITPQYVFRIEAGGAHWSEDCIQAFIASMEGENQ